MRILVTGGSGFIGSNLCSALSREGHEVTSLDLAQPQILRPMLTAVMGDVRDRALVVEILRRRRITHVVHLAARTDLDGRSIRDYNSNTAGVASMLHALEETGGTVRAIFASS